MDITKNGTRHVFLPISFRTWQEEVITNIGRFTGLVCHRRAGKTYFAKNHLILSALYCDKKNPKFWYVCPQLKQARENMWGYLKEAAEYLPNAKISETRSEITFELGDGLGIRTVGLKGADESGDSLRGAYLDGVVLDEMKDMPEAVWINVIRPMLSDRIGWAILTGTVGQGYWFEFWEKEKNKGKDSEFQLFDFKVTTTDVIDQKEQKSLYNSMGMRAYNREYMNDWYAVDDGAYYADIIASLKESGKLNLDVKYNPRIPVITSWDLGLSDATAIWFIQKGTEAGTWNIIDYMEHNKFDLVEKGENVDGKPFHMVMLDKVNAKPYFYGLHILPHDSRQQHGSAAYSTLEQFKQSSTCNVMVARKLPKMSSINVVQSLLGTCRFNVETCVKGIGSLHSYKAKINSDGVESAPKHDRASHGAESFGYFATSIKEIDTELNKFLRKRQNKAGSGRWKMKNPFNPFNFKIT